MSEKKDSCNIFVVAAFGFAVMTFAFIGLSKRNKKQQFLPASGNDIETLSGKEVKSIVAGYGSRIGTDMAKFADREINDSDKYYLARVPLKSIFDANAELKRFVIANKNNPYFTSKEYKEQRPILVQQPSIQAISNAGAQARTGIVRDGYKRVTLAYLNNCHDIPAYIKIQV